MRNWWEKLPNNMKPMLPADWNACKAAGLLKPRRGTRGGSNSRLTNHIQVLDPGTRPRIINTFAPCSKDWKEPKFGKLSKLIYSNGKHCFDKN
jgi:hypothetical protein